MVMRLRVTSLKDTKFCSQYLVKARSIQLYHRNPSRDHEKMIMSKDADSQKSIKTKCPSPGLKENELCST